MAVVYQHIRTDSNKVFYIGMGAKKSRAYSRHGRSGWWKNVTNKTEYYVEIIEEKISYQEAQEKEKYWIKHYGRINTNTGCLINMTDGGDGVLGYKPTKEAIEKTRKANIGRKVSDETRRNMSKAGKGRKFTEEHKKKISEAHKNKKVSLKTREKLSEIRKNNKKQPASKSIIQKTKDGLKIKEWKSLTEAAKFLEKNVSGISLCLNGYTKSAYGYKWEFSNF